MHYIYKEVLLFNEHWRESPCPEAKSAGGGETMNHIQTQK